MSFGRYISSRNTRKLASLEESVDFIVSFLGCKYGHLPFDEAKCEILSSLNYKKPLHFPLMEIEEDMGYTGFCNDYIVHEKYFREDFLERMIATIPSENCKEFKLARSKKDFNVLVTEWRKAGDTVRVHIVEAIIIPNVPFNPTGNDILEFTAETLLRRKKLSNALNGVNIKGRMNFNVDLIRLATESITFINLLQGDNPITFEFKDRYFLYGVEYNENLFGYSIGIRTPESLFHKLKNIEKKSLNVL